MYLVIENTPGYLPDVPPVELETLYDAQQYALSLKKELQEMGYSIVGSYKDGGYYASQDNNDLGRVIEIVLDEEQ